MQVAQEGSAVEAAEDVDALGSHQRHVAAPGRRRRAEHVEGRPAARRLVRVEDVAVARRVAQPVLEEPVERLARVAAAKEEEAMGGAGA